MRAFLIAVLGLVVILALVAVWQQQQRSNDNEMKACVSVATEYEGLSFTEATAKCEHELG